MSDMPLSRAQRRLMLRPVMQTHKEVISHKEMVSGRVNVQIVTQSRQLALQSVPWASDRLETYSCWLFVADNGDDYGSKRITGTRVYKAIRRAATLNVVRYLTPNITVSKRNLCLRGCRFEFILQGC